VILSAQVARMNSENPARLRRDARDGLRKSLPETQDRQDQGASADLSRRLAARRKSAEGHAPLAADLQSVVGNTVVHAALAGAETGPGAIIESALTLGAAGMSVADSTSGLFQNSFMQQQVASSSSAPTLAAAAKTAARHGEDEEFSVDATKKLNTALKRGGRPLPADVRARMESAFGGADFSGVRIHTDGAAVAASTGIRAHAFAVGEHIFFGQGEFQPASRGGQHLLAHELTHVVQAQEGRLRPGQNSGGQAGDIAVSSPHDAHEREAERVAGQVVGELAGAGFGPSEHLATAAEGNAPSSEAVAAGDSGSVHRQASTPSSASGRPASSPAEQPAGGGSLFEKLQKLLQAASIDATAAKNAVGEDPGSSSSQRPAWALRQINATDALELEQSIAGFISEFQGKLSSVQDGQAIPKDLMMVILALDSWRTDDGATWGSSEAGKANDGAFQPSNPNNSRLTQGDYKCSAFVADTIFKATGVELFTEKGRRAFFGLKVNPATANEWYDGKNKSIRQAFHEVNFSDAQMGDILAIRGEDPNRDMGHVGIVLGRASSDSLLYISARDDSGSSKGVAGHGTVQQASGLHIKIASTTLASVWRYTGSSTPAQRNAKRSAAGPLPRHTQATVPDTTGTHLPSQTAAGLRAQLGSAVDGVRIHTGPDAQRFADSLNAKAVTVGTDIYFNKGHFRPGTTEGDALLGHEMHHAVYGGGGKGVSQPGDTHEREADAFGHQFAQTGGTQALTRLGGEVPSSELDTQVGDRLSATPRSGLAAQDVAPELFPSSTLDSAPVAEVASPTFDAPSFDATPSADLAPAVDVAPAIDIAPISTPMGSDSSFSRDVLSGSSPFASDTTSGTSETQAETHAELTIAGKVYRVRVPPSEGQTASANCDLDARPCEGLHLTGGTVNIDADGIVTGGTVRGVLEVPGLFNGTEVALGILPGGQIAPAVQGLPVKVGPASGTVDLSITEAGLTGSGRIQAAELGLPSWVGIQSGELEIHFQGTEVAGSGALQGTATANGVATLEASLENQVLTADVTYTLTPGLTPVPGVVINNGVLTGTITHSLQGGDQAADGPEGGSAGPAAGGPSTDSPATAAPASPATDGPGAEGSGAPTGPDAETAAQASTALQGGGQETTTDSGSGGGPGGGEAALATGGGGQGTDFLLQGSANLTLKEWVNGEVQLAMDPAAGVFNATGTLSAANEMQFGELLAIRSEVSLSIEQNVPTESNAVVEFTAPKVAGTITGTYNIQEHRLDGTANAHLTHHWPLEADWGRFRLLRHGRLDATVENNELKDITGRVRFDATVESGESPLELEGLVEGAFDVKEDKVNGTATGNTAADFLLPSSAEGGATEQFTLLAGSTVRGTVTDNQLSTVTMQAAMRYDREGAPFLEGRLSDATYDIQSSQISGEGTFTLLTSLERSTKNGEWTLRLMEGSEITATVANNSLTELGGDITVQVDDAQGALATGELKSARIEVGTWLTSGTIELSTARKFYHPGEGQTLSSGHSLEVLPGSGISGTLSDDVLTDVGADLRTMIKDEEGSLARLRLVCDYDIERNLVDGKGTLSLARQLTVAENLAGQGWTAKVRRGTKAEGHIEDNDFTKVTGELKARVDDDQGQFLDVTGQGEWTTADDLFDVSGTMTVSREKELASGGEGGWSIALLAEESAATATIEDDVFQGIEGTIATMVRRAEGDFAKVALGGSWNETQGFTGEGEAELMTDLEVATIGAYNLWVVQGAGARIAVDQNSLSEIGGTVPMRLDDSGQEFIRGGVEGTYRIQEKLLSGTGSAEVLVEKHLGTMGDDQLWLIPSTNATITVADNALTEVGGEMNLSVRNGEGEYARIALTGSFDAAGGTGFTGTGSVEVVRDNKLFEQDNYSFWLKVGSGAQAHIEADELKKIDGQVPFMVKDGGPAPLIEGSVEGEYDPTTGQITGTGAVYLGRTLEYDLGGGVQLKLLEGSGGDADVQESQLQRLGGTLTAQIWKDGAGVVEVTAQGEYNVVTNTLTRLEGTARLMQPLSLLDGQIEISELTGTATIENNELVEAGGSGQIVVHPLNDMTGSFELEWSNRGGTEQYSGRGTLEFTLIETDPTTGRGMSGQIEAEVNSDGTFSASGDVDYRVNEFLGGSLQVSVDQEMDPLLSGNIEIDGDLVPGRELFKMERDIIPEQTVRLPYGLALFYGMKGGMGADLDPLSATADIAISNWRPLSEDAAVPTFETELNLTWGMGFQAMVAPYIGLGGDIGFASAQMGVRGEVSLDAHVQAEAGGMLRGDGGGFYGELSVGVSCAPTMDLAIIPYIKGEIPELFSFEEDLDRFEQPLGTIFEFEWGGTYGFGDRTYKRDAPTQDLDVPAPTQRDTQVEGRPEVGIGNGGGAANNQANGPQLESGSEIAAQQQVGEGEMSEVMDTLNDVIAVVEGIGAAGELFGMLASALTALATFGPAGLVVWIVWGIFTGDLSWDRIKEAVIKVIDAVAAAGRLLRDHFPGWWNRIVDVFNGDKPGLLDALFGADDRMRDAVRAGDHLVGPHELHVEMVNTMKGGWLSSADADCIGAVFEEAARRGTLNRLVSECGGADDFIDGWSTGFNDERIKRVFRRNGIDW
jgi:hypothetical protein